ncbi:hypothetical protein BDW22DRAFT_1336015 [Trametopsis cervina]|nr:hypothetical protein BDW22DRAFT_1336015 [Trametopsis cervina]
MKAGRCCTEGGEYFEEGIPIPPPLPLPVNPEDWSPFRDRLQFEVANFSFQLAQLSRTKVNQLLDLWAASLLPHSDEPPFADCNHLFDTIDASDLGGLSWKSVTCKYTGERPATNVPPWMDAEYEFCFRDIRLAARNMLSNPDFATEFDAGPYREYDETGSRKYSDLMSGDWAWRQADIIAQDPNTHGAMFVPVICGSDKTTVSVASGQNDYYPAYMSIGNVHNNVRRAHRDAIIPVAFFAIPKTVRRYQSSPEFRRFRRQLFHSSLALLFEPLREAMSAPEVTRCPDGCYRRVIYGLGPYIADYPEQVLVACVSSGWCPICRTHREQLGDIRPKGPRTAEHTKFLIDVFDPGVLRTDYGIVADIIPFTATFPRANIHELFAGDLLHQVIKGAFKDHLVEWIATYLKRTHGEARGKEYLDQIDHRLAAVPPFPGIRRFADGRDFKQWTGDDSKALMKATESDAHRTQIYLPAIAGIVPSKMVRAVSTFMDFCYLARRSILTDETIGQLEDCLERYYNYRQIFQETGVRQDGFNSLPRQHSLLHYPQHVRNFGAPNGLCSSLTEAMHITAVKKPWRRSNKYNAMYQMLVTVERLDKLKAAYQNFKSRGMLEGTCLSEAYQTLLTSMHEESGSEAGEEGNDEEDRDEMASDEDTNGKDDDHGAVDGPRVSACVSLAKRAAQGYPNTVRDLAVFLANPTLPNLVAQFIYNQENADAPLMNEDPMPMDQDLDYYTVRVFPSAVATFYAPSEVSGLGGMYRERIRATRCWRGGAPRYDCIYVNADPSKPGLRGLLIARVRLLFTVKKSIIKYPCALVEWYSPVEDCADKDTGMWIVSPDMDDQGRKVQEIIHLDSIIRLAHLIGVAGETFVPRSLQPSDSLDAFKVFYASKFADHHAHELAF